LSATPFAPEIVFVVAVAANGVIGRDNAMPWKLKSDMAHFRRVTTGRPVIMGRKTFLSIGKPLKDRTNIVVTRQKDFHAPGVVVAHSLDAALDVARGDAMRRFAAEIAVIGGADIYAQLMDRADRLEITEVHASPEGDTLFPARGNGWQEVARERHEAGEADSAAFSFITLRRAPAAPPQG
jgi:dihydrofolate reductase